MLSISNASRNRVRLYSVTEGNEFDTGVLGPGESRGQAVQSSGLVELLDGDTYAVVARIYVAPGIGARIVHTGQPTTFQNLDPGTYRVAAWHERVAGNERQVTLAPDDARELDLLIGVNALPKVE